MTTGAQESRAERSALRGLAADLAFSLVLVLLAELAFQSLGWHRLWWLVTVFTVGHLLRAGVRRRIRAHRVAARPAT